MIIYKITNELTGKCYIGQTVQSLERRWAIHKSSKRRSPLTSAFKHYGINNFSIQTLFVAIDVADLDHLEIEMIKRFNSLHPNGYNLLPGGNVSQNRGRKPWNKGKKASDKAKMNQSIAHMGQTAWNKCKISCNETGEVFSSIKEAALKLGLQSSKICLVLKGVRKHTGKLTFKYLKETK
jgi:group I intron endonuclease